nr:clathrin light chain 2 [Ipomoea batatas]
MALLLVGAAPMASLSMAALAPTLSFSSSRSITGGSLRMTSSTSLSSSVTAPSLPLIYCGRGDKKTAKGKRFNHSFGNARPKDKKKGRGPPRIPPPPAAAPKKNPLDDGQKYTIFLLGCEISDIDAMSSSFNDAFYQLGDDSPNASSRPFDDGFLNPSADDGSSIFVSPPDQHTSFPPPIYASGGSDPEDEKTFADAFATSNSPVLPPPSEMQEEGFALREWRRQNALLLEEKEKREKEVLSQIIDEADGYKVEFYKKREVKMEANKVICREKEKIFLASHEKFHAEADKHYWKAISELIPNEVPTIVKKGKKDQEKKPSIAVIQELVRLIVAIRVSDDTLPAFLLGPDLTLFVDDAGFLVIGVCVLPGTLRLISCHKGNSRRIRVNQNAE